jgi:hypothetical protein
MLMLLRFALIVSTLFVSICDADSSYLNQSAIASDSLRSGFEGTYAVANAFLDSMTPQYGLIFHYNTTNYSISDVEANITSFFSGKSWNYYIDQV